MMTDPIETPAAEPAAETKHRRIAFERLRERTDELELLVSGLTVFALLSAPSYLLALWMRSHVHLEGALHTTLGLAAQMGIGLCYALAGLFLLHIVVRSYWIGLVGLKSAFPTGIRWDKAKNVGPFTRDFYQRRLPDMDSVIDQADRTASIVFATANVVAIAVVWMSILISAVIALASLAVSYLGLSERVLAWIVIAILMPPVVAALIAWTIDNWVIPLRPALARRVGLRRCMELLLRVNIILPMRLILPLQLTTHGSSHTTRFSVLLGLLIFLVPLAGSLTVAAEGRFSLLGNYSWFDDDSLNEGLRSVHYEDMRTSAEAGQPVPTIPSDRIAEAWLRLFLPHMPARDNALLAKTCAGSGQGQAPRHDCTARLWQVRLGDTLVDPSTFVATERRDLGWRGFQAYLPMQGLAPGRYDLHVVWNPEGDDSGLHRRREYRIPFWLSPGFELSVP